MKVTVCIDYATPTGASTMMCRTFDLPVVPQAGDDVETLPESEDGDVSETHLEVVKRYVGPDTVEVHARADHWPTHTLQDAEVERYRAHGYRVPGEAS